ncbi:class I lanthipeptide [Chitinophaga varians]|uniref:class I lanthipeptide n=1 Tax=Chitinophaga varians TaxID=2202339 RepID=UPI00165F6E7E|nr:class I lanthipeptide [Chitinophaga varians]MBC9909521.1 class I lanthipeptide [Chitinophaga varians]
MKKKKISIDRKLMLGKSPIASLNDNQQEMIVGGIPVTRLVNCTSRLESCATAPSPTRPCQLCP